MDKKLKISHDLSKPDKKTQLVNFNNIVKTKINIDLGLRKTLEFYIKNHA